MEDTGFKKSSVSLFYRQAKWAASGTALGVLGSAGKIQYSLQRTMINAKSGPICRSNVPNNEFWCGCLASVILTLQNRNKVLALGAVMVFIENGK